MKKKNNRKKVETGTESVNEFDRCTNTIMKGIKKVCEPIKFTEISIYDNIDTCLKIDNHEYTLDEIISAFEEYITILSPNILTYKC